MGVNSDLYNNIFVKLLLFSIVFCTVCLCTLIELYYFVQAFGNVVVHLSSGILDLARAIACNFAGGWTGRLTLSSGAVARELD